MKHSFGDWGVVTIWRGLTLPNAAPPIFIQISVEREREDKVFLCFRRENKQRRKKEKSWFRSPFVLSFERTTGTIIRVSQCRPLLSLYAAAPVFNLNGANVRDSFGNIHYCSISPVCDFQDTCRGRNKKWQKLRSNNIWYFDQWVSNSLLLVPLPRILTWLDLGPKVKKIKFQAPGVNDASADLGNVMLVSLRVQKLCPQFSYLLVEVKTESNFNYKLHSA